MIGIGVDPTRIEVTEREGDIARVRYYGVEFEVQAQTECAVWSSSSGTIEQADSFHEDASPEDMAADIAGQIAARLAVHVGAGKGGAA